MRLGPFGNLGVLIEELEVLAEIEDIEEFLVPPGPNRLGHRRVPRPSICQNLVFERTVLKKTRFRTSGTSMPVSSMSTEIAMCGGLFAMLKSSISDCAYSVWKSISARRSRSGSGS